MPFFSIIGNPNSGIKATGGTITTSGKYKIHTFTSSDTFTITANPNNERFDIFALGGGGGGNGGGLSSPYQWAGAGGSPGQALESSYTIANGAYAVTIGAAASATSLGSIVTAAGGPASNSNYASQSVPTAFPALGVSATYFIPSSYWPYSGSSYGGTYTTDISGTSTTYGGCGGRGSDGSSTVAPSGTGGAGGASYNANGSNATGYGAGGGGGGMSTSGVKFNGGSGSQGILIVRYRA